MSTLEHEIIEKFHQLDKDAQKRVQAIIQQANVSDDTTTFDYEAWLHDVEAIRQQIQMQHHGAFPTIEVVDILRDIRDGEDE